MAKRVLGIFILAAALGCGTSGGPSDSGSSEFGRESGSSDPGLRGGGGTSGSMASAAGLGTIYFDFDQSILRGDAREMLRRNAEFMGSNGDVRIEIQGNCDERGSDEYNLALGMRRAEAAKRYLMDLGVNASRLGTISYGEENPVVRGHNESAWAKNRRGDFVTR